MMKYEGYVRLLLIAMLALGVIGMPCRAATVDDKVPGWVTALQTGDSMARFNAELAIIKNVKECTQTAKLVQPLILCLTDASDTVRTDAAVALSSIKVHHPEVDLSSAVLPIIARMQDPAAKVRNASANALGNLRDPRGVQPLVTALSDSSAGVVNSAVLALGLFLDPKTADALAKVLTHREAFVRGEAAIALGKLGDRRAVKTLIDMLNGSGNTPYRAAEQLGNLGDPSAVEPLCVHLPKSKAKHIVITALGKLRDPRAIETLAKAFGGDEVQFAIRALKAIGDTQAVPHLIALLKDRVTPTHSPPECSVAVDALKSITGQDFGLDAGKWQAWWETQE
ncbi:MAG: HEAT repeat domain-containing protein [Armatimonadota bacterium]